ncbi:hypothetical protein INQ51_01970 [Maribellus sp. CM-23]|uniref:hypothetical protein n=1 Tax=Maribellus sp. CM-23 TaxID=2781026 RepID=UPI001F285AF5|nr:hypothetical protein [Maribellus sp. CM-23]MCE4563067.1 hypothetical protein [Maribellus sp. CM-23]
MKRVIYLIGIFAGLLLFLFSCSEGVLNESVEDLSLKSGNKGNEKLTGFDEWGFNWQAQAFTGYTINMLLGDHYYYGWPHFRDTVYRGEGEAFWDMVVEKYYLEMENGFQWHYFPELMPGDLLDTRLVAHWNDGIISKEGVYPPTFAGTNGWITFHYFGESAGQPWSSFRKLVSVKEGDTMEDGVWYNHEGKEIGLASVFWPDLVVVQVVNTGDVPPYSFFYHDYVSPNGPGFGHYKSK